MVETGIQIFRVRTAHSMRAWVTFPRRVVYGRTSLWAAPADRDVRRTIDPQRNPYFRHAEGAPLLARDGRGRVVGRLFVHVNHRYNVRHGERAAWFGFFECVDNVEIARALVNAAAAFAVKRGCTVLRGPVSLTMMQEVGVIVDGFNEAPGTDMTYTAAHYPALLECSGLLPKMAMTTMRADNIAALDPEASLGERHRALLVEGRLHIRPLDVRHIDAEIEIVRELINDAYYDTPFFVPLTADEYRFLVRPFLRTLDPHLLLIAELDGVPVAFQFSVPDINPLQRRLRGHSGPLATLRTLPVHDRPRDAVGSLMGVQRHLRSHGIMRVLLAEMIRALQQGGYRRLFINWTAESNERSLAVTQPLGWHVLHHLRLYERDLLAMGADRASGS